MSDQGGWKELEKALIRVIGDKMRPNEPMSRHTWIGVGGAARVLAEPTSIEEVAGLVRLANRRGMTYLPVGKGSNLIVRDGGFDGIVIKLGGPLCKVTINERTVRAGGGAAFALLSRKMTKMDRTGLEFGIGIPGTVGGAVRMNAGAFGGEVKDVLRRVKVVDTDGRVRVFRAEELEFSYRRCSLPQGAVVVSATFNCPPGKIRRDVYERSLGRKDTQPIDERTFGSTFVNPPGGFAAEMIEGCGLKGRRRGGAMVSPKHANFIVNPDGKASASDVEYLIQLMHDEVKKKYGVSLQTEVIIVGNR